MKDFKLDSEPRIKSGFKAPDAYFESFADRVMLQLPAQEVKVVPLYRRMPIWVTSAAAALVLSLSLIFTEKDNATITTAPVSELSPDAIGDYLLHQEGISSYELIQNLDHKEISELQQLESISDEAIDEYLDAENIEL